MTLDIYKHLIRQTSSKADEAANLLSSMKRAMDVDGKLDPKVRRAYLSLYVENLECHQALLLHPLFSDGLLTDEETLL